MFQNSELHRRPHNGSSGGVVKLPIAHRAAIKGRVLVVEDDETIRESVELLLEQKGYEVSVAENGREALRRLYSESLPDIILLDLRMPVMDGWEFRRIQKDDPKLGRIPVVAISADGSAQAAAISAQAYLPKPVGGHELLTTIERVLLEHEQQKLARLDETERLASLGRMAAAVGHEINNPLAFVILNLGESLEKLRPYIRALGIPAPTSLPEVEIREIRAGLMSIADMLEDCQIGGERIRETVSNMQRLSRTNEDNRGAVDIHKLIDQSVSMAWNQIRHRARLIKDFGTLPLIHGNATALGQVFLNLLVNAAHAIPEGDAESNEIRISTRLTEGGSGLLVEISDSGKGIAPGNMSHVFEPFFTTKPVGQGTGLGLSISHQAVMDHGGRITVDSEPDKGCVFRVFLPVGDVSRLPLDGLSSQIGTSRGRILVIDDEPLIGRIIQTALKEHEVLVVKDASEALSRFERGEIFDLVLCDVVMPDLSGPEFYATVEARWPHLGPKLVFMTGGAFTPATIEFMKSVPTRVLSKPFKIERLKRLVQECLRGNA